MKVKHIHSFTFNKAEYHIRTKKSALLLVVDYKNNQFTVIEEKTGGDETLVKEAESIAHDLLRRKHGVNFAER